MGVVTWCRLCAIQKESVVEIYEDEGQKLNLETKITKCLQIELYSEDPLPKSVCLDCCSKLDICLEFVVGSTRAQETLHMIFLEPKVEEHETAIQDERSNFMDRMPESIFPTTQETFPEAEIADPGPSKFLECVLDFHAAIGVNKTSTHEGLSIKEAKGQPSSSFTKCDFQKQKQIFEISDEKMNTTSNSLRKRRDGWEQYPWMCTDCSQELPSMQALRVHHHEEHKQPPRFMCAQCSKVYTKYYGFVSHVRRHRNHMKFRCEECGKCFSNKKVLESHRATHSDARPFVCSECGKSFRQQSALYVHTRSHQPDSIKNRYPCDQCDKRFSTKPNLVTHKRIHTGIRNFTCDQCGKSFIQKGNLDAHLLTHSVDKPYTCSVCSKGFKTPLQLRKHQTVHTGAKPHQCDVCGRQFRERGTLREHHRIHTGAMPFTCEFCGKSFRFKGILTTHRRQHTGERPYSCLECQHHFTNWPNYNKHMKRRHGINTSVQPDPNKLVVAAASVTEGNSVTSSISSSISHESMLQPSMYNQIHSMHDDNGSNFYNHMGHYVQTQVQAPTELNFYNISQLHLYAPGNSIDNVHNR